MHHWTEHNIRVHVFTAFGLQIAHRMRRHARPARLHMSVRELLRELAGIGAPSGCTTATGACPGPTGCRRPQQQAARLPRQTFSTWHSQHHTVKFIGD